MVVTESMADPRVELQVGRSYMDSNGATTVFAEKVFSGGSIGSTRFSWAPQISAGWIDGRDMERYQRANCTTTDAVWLVAGGVRLRYGTEGDWFHSLFFSFQPALHSGRTMALSSPYEFVSSFGWQGNRFSFQFRHISNGSLREPNRGETMALLGIRLGRWQAP
ncbi:acyloxyacyl hydrolase [Dyella humicola]|uniref:acyloxyacyl hydrolase n=1 Tax=Dyella humicola TaxID=2992126 RepID=UPI002250B77D|nr:acyloxyacyl hydrolase [Dyella humicola]